MTNIKFTAIDEIDYEDLKQICEEIKKLGYTIKFEDNGNFVAEK